MPSRFVKPDKPAKATTVSGNRRSSRNSRRDIRVAVVDDHPVTRLGVAAALASEPRIRVSISVGRVLELERVLGRHQIDVVIIDTRRKNDRDTVAAIRRWDPMVRTLVLSGAESGATVMACLDAGADGYVSKRHDPSLLIDGVIALHKGVHQYVPESLARALERSRRLADGQTETVKAVAGLSARQRRIIKLVAQGLTNGQIARRIDTTENAVDMAIARIRRRLGADNKAELVRIAGEHGLL